MVFVKVVSNPETSPYLDKIPRKIRFLVYMTENTVSPVWSAQIQPVSPRFAGNTCRAEVTMVREPVAERKAKNDLKWYLMNKYRDLFTEKITRDDLEELQYCLRRQSDPKNGWNREYNKRVVLKLGEYMAEDILRSEIAGIEALLTLMKPEDLEEGTGVYSFPERRIRHTGRGQYADEALTPCRRDP
jgi:hypothetical protein